MKNLAFLLLSFLFLSACNTSNSLIGSWQIQSVSVEGKIIPIDDCAKKSFMIFDQNQIKTHSFSINRNQDCIETLIEASYTIEGNTLKMNDKNGRKDALTFVQRKDTLSLSKTFEVQGRKVISVTTLTKK